MSQYVRLALAMEFVMSRPGDMRMMADDVMSPEDEDVSVTHIDYIHDEAGYEMDEPRFVIKLQKTFEVSGVSSYLCLSNLLCSPESEHGQNAWNIGLLRQETILQQARVGESDQQLLS